ncbi:MAG: PH domain-containing protein [Pseudomonadota bacterium]|nr:PH domain-containing protein [Pseudomonadota bacterium]
MTVETVADRRLHPATLVIRSLRSLPQFVFGIPAFAAFASDTPFGDLVWFALAAIPLAMLPGFIIWRSFRYGVGAREIVIESGVVNRQRRVILFDRIQDVDIEQGLLARLFGTAKVRIETGGAAKNEGDIDSIALDEAHRLRAALRRGQAGAAADDAAEAPAVEVGEPLLFRLSFRRLLLSGIFNFSLVYLAAIFGALQYVEALFGIDPWSLDWVDPARDLAAQASWGLSLLAAVAVILLGAVIGIARTIARDFGFTLTRAEVGLRRRRGLFTLSEVMIPFRRVQLALVRSGPIDRLFGWYALEFQTLSADAAKAGHQMAVPFGRSEDVAAVLAEVDPAPFPDDGDYIRISKRAIARHALRAALLLGLPVLLLALRWPATLALLLVVPLVAAAGAIQYRHHRYCLTDRHLHIRAGIFTRRLWRVPYEKLQAAIVSQGPLQRALGLASIAVDTAGASALHAPHIANISAAAADGLQQRLIRLQREARAQLRRDA